MSLATRDFKAEQNFGERQPPGVPGPLPVHSGQPRFFTGTFPWYNQEHRHSGLGLLTPAMVHYNQTALVLEQRQALLDAPVASTPNASTARPANQKRSQPRSRSTNRPTQMKNLTKF